MHYLFLIFLTLYSAFQFNSLDKQRFYEAFSSNDSGKIGEQLAVLKNSPETPSQKAYTGALLMKKAGFEKKPADKIALFKEGKLLLENEIAQDPQNMEFRFLRLAIQENAPKILGYQDQLEEDKKIVVQNYKRQEKVLKKAILDYTKTSKVINAADLE